MRLEFKKGDGKGRLIDLIYKKTVRPMLVELEFTTLLRDLEPYGIKEMVQSGMVAIGRGSRSITTGPALRAA